MRFLAALPVACILGAAQAQQENLSGHSDAHRQFIEESTHDVDRNDVGSFMVEIGPNAIAMAANDGIEAEKPYCPGGEFCVGKDVLASHSPNEDDSRGRTVSQEGQTNRSVHISPYVTALAEGLQEMKAQRVKPAPRSNGDEI